MQSALNFRTDVQHVILHKCKDRYLEKKSISVKNQKENCIDENVHEEKGH